MSADSLIAFRDVSLAFGDRLVLGDLTFEIGRGEIVCIIGPSGCGKTTALRVAAGLVAPNRGEVTFAGAADHRPAPRRRRRLSGLFQGAAAVAHRRGQRVAGARSDGRHAPRAACAHRRTAGQGRPRRPRRQIPVRSSRAACSSGCKSPAVLRRSRRRCMMDEPFGALDAMTRQTLQDEMLDIARATGATIFFVTHDLEEAIYLGDRVIGLQAHPGRIGIEVEVDLPRPRNQVTTREAPEFLRLRRELYDFISGKRTRREGRSRVVRALKALALPVLLVLLAEIGARLVGQSDSIAPPLGDRAGVRRSGCGWLARRRDARHADERLRRPRPRRRFWASGRHSPRLVPGARTG